jgi:predicted RND superfamily exporter protein
VSSQFTPFNKFGLLTAVGLVAALLFDLLALPAILMLVYGRKGKGTPASA